MFTELLEITTGLWHISMGGNQCFGLRGVESVTQSRGGQRAGAGQVWENYLLIRVNREIYY